MLRNAIMVCALLTSSAAFSADGPIVMRGCTSGGVEGCLFVKSPKGTYALYIAEPRPEQGRGISMTGTINNGPNICMTGPGIQVAKWHYIHRRCPQ
jgi:hypothetical protein